MQASYQKLGSGYHLFCLASKPLVLLPQIQGSGQPSSLKPGALEPRFRVQTPSLLPQTQESRQAPSIYPQTQGPRPQASSVRHRSLGPKLSSSNPGIHPSLLLPSRRLGPRSLLSDPGIGIVALFLLDLGVQTPASSLRRPHLFFNLAPIYLVCSPAPASAASLANTNLLRGYVQEPRH